MSNTNVVYAKTYVAGDKAGDGAFVETYMRHRTINAWKHDTLMSLVNIATRNGWVVTHWQYHHGFFPSARLVKTFRRDNDEAIS